MKTASMIIFLGIYFAMGIGLLYSVAGHDNVTNGIEESLRIGITR